MICPKCGNEISLFADNCMICGISFKSMSLAERQRLNAVPPIRKTIPHPKRSVKPKRVVQPKVEKTPIRMTYDNGIPVGEGMSVTGSRMKRGAHRPFLYKY